MSNFVTFLCSLQNAIPKGRRAVMNASGPKCPITMSVCPRVRRAHARTRTHAARGRGRREEREKATFVVRLSRLHRPSASASGRRRGGERAQRAPLRRGRLSKALTIPSLSPLPSPLSASGPPRRLRLRLQQFVIDGRRRDDRVALLQLRRSKSRK